MFNKAQLDELRPLVAETPEGSVARTLLGIIDAAIAATYSSERRRVLGKIQQQNRTAEEAEAIVAAWEDGGKVEMETVKCWECEGWGIVQTPGCMGSSNGQCPTCHGNQRASRFKMPEAKESA